MDYIQADSKASFSYYSTFTPLIKSHKGNNASPQNVNRAIPLKFGKRKIINSFMDFAYSSKYFSTSFDHKPLFFSTIFAN